MLLTHGTLAPQADLEHVLASLAEHLPALLANPPAADLVIECAARFADALQHGQTDLPLDEVARQALIDFCRKEALETKLQRELGDAPFSLRRNSYTSQHFESWRPLGLVVHITPANAPLLPFFAVLESLLVGNVNWLRPSSSDDGLTARLLAALLSHDPSGTLAEQIAVIPCPTAQLPKLFKLADGVSAWGGDAALDNIKQQVPAGCRWIDWGHRISFAYVVPGAASDADLAALADDVCQLDQQACSSPQCVLVDSDDPATLRELGERLALAMGARCAVWQGLTPTRQEAAEIATRLNLTWLSYSFAEVVGHTWVGEGWRILWSHRPELAPSPLFRTILLRPLPRQHLSQVLQPWRTRLQTCGLVADAIDQAALARQLLAAGVTRVVPLGHMHQSYDGEPHDGVYALARLARRVSVTLAHGVLPGHATLDPLPRQPTLPAGLPIMCKTDFQALPMQADAQLFFRSGGSGGAPKLAGFSYRDYHRQMRAAADGLFAAGLDPAQDRVMNLLYGGNLYGGLLSFFSILEKLSATHFPMGGPLDEDYSQIADMIIAQRVNTLIGMPSTIHKLFVCEADRLRAYGGVDKVLLGGEQSNAAQRAYLQSFGVKQIRSAIYGSVDAGPLGHACPHSPDGVFHLLADTQWLEIVVQDADQAVTGTEIGRLIFTSRAREGQHVNRYDLGDAGRWVPGPCPCGLPSPRFELTGRQGQSWRLGTVFFDPNTLSKQLGYPLQCLIGHNDLGTEMLTLLVDGSPDHARSTLMADPLIAEAIDIGLLILDIQARPIDRFEQHPQSGKSPLVIDRRQLSPNQAATTLTSATIARP
ncbi:phenylacetate-coenzyme A ligase PaaK-like adenylate-forming protein [Chitinivorax tropicus]|uniref:long-chain-fatty-acyl-CoA reductase n=1 Tax=Chitinivorax tropicus TaxID=714531 RepID=A0A840ML19_9PROT|nr:acyl-CoA reductase [Chitinivorax tropicus]MBB5016843.1 phenylacetate-coenzyme A ligase PaaK-like adenylate-forming protein [Chitinivorax tropicus]